MSDQQLIPVFIPALVTLLAHSEQLKGSPLTEQEVLEVRDKGVCIMMRVEHALALDEKRGYGDELLSIVVDGRVELGGGLGEGEAVLEDGSADDIGE